MNTRILLIIIVSVLVYIPSAYAQDYGAALQQYQEQSRQLTLQMQKMKGNLVQQNMQNPRVLQMYQQHLQSGGSMSLQDFAYNYAATGGFTPEGKQRWNQSERAIQQNDQAAIQAYRQNQINNAQAMQQAQQRSSDIARQRGNLLNGTTDYIDPSTGTQYNLPHTVQPNTIVQDPSSNTFYNDSQGNYHRENPNGYWNDLEEEE